MAVAERLSPERVEHAMQAVVKADIGCKWAGDRLLLSTPYVLQDGGLMRVYMSIDPDTLDLVVSDGGYATEQVELHAANRAAERKGYEDIRGIAKSLGLDYNGEIFFNSYEVEAAAQRVAVLARAVELTLSGIQKRTAVEQAEVYQRVLWDLQENGWKVKRHAPIGMKDSLVRVDYAAQKGTALAAIEVLTGNTNSSAETAIARSTVNFQLLDHWKMGYGQFAAYDETSYAASDANRHRFELLKPKNTLLLPSSELLPAVEEFFLRAA